MYKKYSLIPMIMSTFIAMGCSDDDKLPKDDGKTDSSSTKLVLTPFADLNAGASEINSHANYWQSSSLKMDYRSYQDLGSDNNVVTPSYSRITQLKDGSYILTWQNAQDAHTNGKDTYYSLSPDLKTWNYKGYLWQSYGVTNALGNSDKRYFTNANTIQLSSGDILAISAYHAVKTYFLLNAVNDHGLIIKRSSDGGKTWYGEQEIYHGPSWEAHLIELASGELQCFFSESRPWISGSHTGTSMVRSTDGGTTWEPALGDTPYRVMRKTWWNAPLNMYCYTYQMPVGVIRNGSKQFVFAMESCNQRVVQSDGTTQDEFSIAIVRSNEDGSWNYLTGEEITPKSQRIDSLSDRGGGPYLAQFPSGEMLVSYTNSSYFQQMRIGNIDGTKFGVEFAGLPGKGIWDCLCRKSPHQMISSMRNVSNGKDNATIALAVYNLNHAIKASSHAVKVDGNNSDWVNTDDALFVGSKCQAQATLRCAADNDNYYFLVEVLDQTLSEKDFANIMLSPANANLSAKALRVRVGCNGLKSTDHYSNGWSAAEFNVKATVAFDGTPTDNSDTDNGFLAEISIPRSAIELTGNKLYVNFGYYDATANAEDVIADTSVATYWIPIVLGADWDDSGNTGGTGGSSDSDDSGNQSVGPSWENGNGEHKWL